MGAFEQITIPGIGENGLTAEEQKSQDGRERAARQWVQNFFGTQKVIAKALADKVVTPEELAQDGVIEGLLLDSWSESREERSNEKAEMFAKLYAA